MYGQKKSLLATFENYFDMLLNAVSIYIGWLLCCIAMRPTIYLDTIEATVGIILAVIGSGFVYQAFNIYARPMFYRVSSSMLRIVEANIVAAGLVLIAIVSLCSDESQERFMILWTVI